MTGGPRNASFVPHEFVAQETVTCVRLGRPSLTVFSIHHAAGGALVKKGFFRLSDTEAGTVTANDLLCSKIFIYISISCRSYSHVPVHG